MRRPAPDGLSLPEKAGFFRRVYDLVARIPPGRVATYGQIAALLEHPRWARTVGWALHSLPEDLSHLPWHRVLNGQGRISTRPSSAEQRRRLEAEGVRFDPDDRVPLGQFLWDGPEP